MPPAIRRYFSWVAGRRVHYRLAGSGPPVVLVHQSPASSAEMVSLIRRLAADWTVIAPDTPGNGLSQPLTHAQPTMVHYAHALVGLMDSLGLTRAALYGFHSGAACALTVADLFPARVDAVIANGYTRMTPEELTDVLEHYLLPLPLDWSGSHLAWLWARIREQYLFFPWYRADAAHRLRSGLPRVESMHAAVMDLLRAGANYANPYRAAFTCDRDAALRAMRVPALVMTARNDALYHYLDRMPPPAPAVRVARPNNYAEACDLLIQMLREHARSAPLPKATSTPPGSPTQLHRDALQLSGGSLLVWRAAAPAAGTRLRPVLYCHDSAGSADAMQPYMRPLVGARAVLACDLPGNGETESFGVSAEQVGTQADLLADACQAAGFAAVDVVAEGDAAVVALEFALRHPSLVHAIALNDLDAFMALRTQAQFDPADLALPLRAHGEHLLTAWHRARDERLFARSYGAATGEVRGPSAGELDPASIQQRAIDLLKSRESLPLVLRQRLAYPLEQRLATPSRPLLRAAAARTPDGAAAFMKEACAFFDYDRDPPRLATMPPTG